MAVPKHRFVPDIGTTRLVRWCARCGLGEPHEIHDVKPGEDELSAGAITARLQDAADGGPTEKDTP